MTCTIDLEDTLRKAEGIYKQVVTCKKVPKNVQEILGLQLDEV